MNPSRSHLRRNALLGVVFAWIGSGVTPAAGQGPPATPVRHTEAQQYAVRGSLYLTGSVESRRISVVASEVEGVVEALLAREGDRVEKGKPLVRLRRTSLELRLQAVKGQLQEAEARQDLAQTSLRRSRGLFDEQIISQQQLDDADSEFEAWQGRVAQLQAEAARLEDDLARTTVRAPFYGIVVREMVAEGEWLGSGGAVVELLDYRDLEVTVEVPEGSFAGLTLGSPARVVLSSLGNLEVEGKVRAVVPRADAQARTFPVKVAIDNAEGRIAVGMLARVELLVGDAREAVIVPKDAIVEQGRESFVFRIQDDETVERVPVKVGSATGAWVGIEGGIAVGDRVITRGNERVFPGQSVQTEVQVYPLP
jgi:RND family efflux transporter MFP subunit